MNIIVLGAGTFGTAIGNELSVNTENKVVLFSRNQSKVDEINTFNTNKSCFPNKHLSQFLSATTDKKQIANADIVFIALPSLVIIENLNTIKEYFKEDVLLVSLSKGLFPEGVTIVEGIKNLLNTDNIVALKGPSFAVELMERSETLLTLGYKTKRQYELINRIVNNTALYLDYTTDIRGVEILSVIKNIYALFIGIVDAKYNSANTRFMVLTKTFSEIRYISSALGGSENTLFLACGLGDFCLTSLNDLSRNRTLGLLIGKGFFAPNQKSNRVVTEGLKAVEVVYRLLDAKDKIDLPILNKLHNFIITKKSIFEIEFDELIKIEK